MKSVIVGAGTYGEVYLSYLRSEGVDIVGFIDDDLSRVGTKVDGVPVLGTSDGFGTMMMRGAGAIYCPIGSNQIRVCLIQKARAVGLSTPNFVHRRAVVDSHLPENSAIYILPGVVVMPHVTIEQDVMISMGAHVAHHTTLRQGVFLSTGVSVGASIELGRNVYVGMSATLVTGKCKRAGSNSVIGAGAVVLSDVTPDTVVAGIPARVIRKISK